MRDLLAEQGCPRNGGEGTGWIEHRSVRYDMQLTWEGDKARVEFGDGEVVEGRWFGGELVDEWDEETNHVFMTGPATDVFDGEYTLIK